MKPGSVRPNQRMQEASGRVWGGQEVDPRRIGISAGAKCAVANMGRASRVIFTRPGSQAEVPGKPFIYIETKAG